MLSAHSAVGLLQHSPQFGSLVQLEKSLTSAQTLLNKAGTIRKERQKHPLIKLSVCTAENINIYIYPNIVFISLIAS